MKERGFLVAVLIMASLNLKICHLRFTNLDFLTIP